MARRLFFVPEVRRGLAELTGSDAEHLVRVLRAEVGEVYAISDNNHAYLAQIESARKASVIFRVIELLPPPPAQSSVHLFPALFKFDRFEWMLEKAVELGVTRIETFTAARSEQGLAQGARKRLARWERIALEASQQSRRVKLPEIGVGQNLEEVLMQEFQWKLLLDESNTAPPIMSLLESGKRGDQDRIGILLGPEGGWTDGEREMITRARWAPCSLGSTILRSETAAIAAIGVVNALWQR